MQSVIQDGPLQMRPAGLRAMSMCCFVLAAYLVVNGTLVAIGVWSLASGAYLLGEYSLMGPVLYFLLSVGLVVLGIGLLRGWRWMRRLAIVASAFLIATAVMPVSAAVIDGRYIAVFAHGAKIVLAMIAIRYLLSHDVVEYFSARR